MTRFIKLYMSVAGVFLFAILGILYGAFLPTYLEPIKPIGILFIKLIKMPLIAIIFICILNAILQARAQGKVLRLGSVSISYFIVINFVAGIIGIIISYYMQPGIGVSRIPKELLTLSDDLKKLTSVKLTGFWDFIIDVVPSNPLEAIRQEKIISIVFFTLFFAIALHNVKHPKKQSLIDAIGVLNEALMWIINKVMYLAPIAVFSLLAYFVGTAGVQILVLAAKLVLSIVVAGFVWIYIVLGLLITLFTKVSYKNFILRITKAQILALSTSSSLATLPTTLKCNESLGVRADVSNFVTTLGSNLNNNGSACYYCILTLFFAQMFGIHISFTTYILMGVMTAIGSMHPGIPGLSLTVVLVMLVANVPIIGLPLIIALDKILDPFITMVNVSGNMGASILVNKAVGD
jgi:Na+/H+-dicarboxylate symporter